jgi:hypothetical protein
MAKAKLKKKYQTLAKAYILGARAVLASEGKREAKKPAKPGAIAKPTPQKKATQKKPAKPKSLKAKAKKLEPISEKLTRLAARKLISKKASARLQGEAQLLAKAATDLQIGAHLLNVASRRGKTSAAKITLRAEPPVVLPASAEPNFRIIYGLSARRSRGLDAEDIVLTDKPSAIAELKGRVITALDEMSARCVNVAWLSVDGVGAIGVTRLLQASETVVVDIASLFGAGEQAGGLIKTATDFVAQAYQALRAVMGYQALDLAIDKMAAWLRQIERHPRETIGQLIERLLETARTKKELVALAGKTNAPLVKIGNGVKNVARLNEAHKARMDLAWKLERGLRVVSIFSISALPQAQLALAFGYLLIGAYAIFTTADYVDAPKLKRINRVSGIRAAMTRALA